MSKDTIALPTSIPADVKNPINYLRGYNGANRCRINKSRLEQAASILTRAPRP